MEILNVFGVHWKLLTAQVINFSIALFILHRYLYTPVFAMLKKRQDQIAQGLQDAELAALAKADIESEKAAILAHAREEGGGITESLRKHALNTQHEMIKEAQEKYNTILSEAQKNADALREHTLRESEKDVARMAILAAEKILRGEEGSKAVAH